MDNLERLAVQRTRELIGVAATRFGIDIPHPSVRFDLRGKAAGQMRSSDGFTCLIRYNCELLKRYPEDFLATTVPHETAHLVAFFVFGRRVKPHGREWQSIMHLFGAEPRRCHEFDVDGLQARKVSRYHYRCACSSHQLTSIRHNRILEGQVYRCGRCGHPLERIPEREKDAGS